MKADEKSPRTVLFLSKNASDSQFAQSVFESEAQKMDLFWTASACALDELIQLPEQSTNDNNVLNADLVIVLQQTDGKPLSLEQYGSWSGEKDYWDIAATSDLITIVQQNVKSLLVRLILKGGKRETKPIQQTNQSSSDRHATKPSSKGNVRVSLESKGRRGKKVTTVSGLPQDETSLLELATLLKRVCGSGGTLKDGTIEIQGDHRDLIMAELQKQGHKPKRAGGG